MSTPTPDSIDQLLPQTQCQQCGYDGCRPYAEAIANGTPHNQCPPGGNKTIQALARHLNRPLLPLNPENGTLASKTVAVIEEDLCIGCTKCIQACPVDAIFGASKKMHTVIATECTGCNLCVEPCPVDCINMIPLPQADQYTTASSETQTALRSHYRNRLHAREARLATQAKRAHKTHTAQKDAVQTPDQKRAYIQAAIQRKREQQHKQTPAADKS